MPANTRTRLCEIDGRHAGIVFLSQAHHNSATTVSSRVRRPSTRNVGAQRQSRLRILYFLIALRCCWRRCVTSHQLSANLVVSYSREIPCVGRSSTALLSWRTSRTSRTTITSRWTSPKYYRYCRRCLFSPLLGKTFANLPRQNHQSRRCVESVLVALCYCCGRSVRLCDTTANLYYCSKGKAYDGLVSMAMG